MVVVTITECQNPRRVKRVSNMGVGSEPMSEPEQGEET